MSAPAYNSIECPVVTFRPNWATPPRLVQEYATLVYEKLDLSEERLQQRPRCLYGITYDVTTFGPRETGSARRFFETLPTTPIGVPFWMDAVTASAALTAGAAVIPITDGDNRLFDVFPGYVLVWESWDKYEAIEFAGLTTLEISLTGTLANSYGAGALVVPLAWGKIKRPEFRQITGSHAEFTVEFMEYFHALPGVPQILPETPELLAPELTETTCHDEFTIAISQSGAATILAAPSRYGDYVEIMVTDGETDAVIINNDFPPWDGSWWFRVEYEGGYKTRPVNPAGPNVKPPEIVMGTIEYPLPVSLRGFPTDLFSSVAEPGENNPFIQPDPLAVRITQRYERNTSHNSNENINTVVNRNAGGVWTQNWWTSDNTDPKTSTTRIHFNGYPFAFAGVMKARTQIGDCWSPMTLVAVDLVADTMCVGQVMAASAYTTGSNEPCLGLTDDGIKDRIIAVLCAASGLASWNASEPFNSFTYSYSINEVLTVDGYSYDPPVCSVGWTGAVSRFYNITTNPTPPGAGAPIFFMGIVKIDAGFDMLYDLGGAITLAEYATSLIGAYTFECGHVETPYRVTKYQAFYTALLTI